VHASQQPDCRHAGVTLRDITYASYPTGGWSVMDITVAPCRVTVCFDHHKAASTVADQRRIARAIDDAMALAPCDVADEVQGAFPLAA
jgi:hypothetical protein